MILMFKYHYCNVCLLYCPTILAHEMNDLLNSCENETTALASMYAVRMDLSKWDPPTVPNPTPLLTQAHECEGVARTCFFWLTPQLVEHGFAHTQHASR